MSDAGLRVAVATPLPPELRSLIRDREPRLELLVDDELLPPMRFPADFAGDPDYRRTPAQQERFEQMLDHADVLYGIPDVSPEALKRVADANPRLRWVHTMAAGGGGQVRAARLDREQLDRISFTTSAGVHGDTLAEFALFGLLAGLKRLPHLERLQRAHEWPSRRWPLGQLAGSRVLVAGLGGIGSPIVALLKAFGATVVGLARGDTPRPGVDELVDPGDLVRAVGAVDAIVSSLPGTALTEGLFSADVWAAVRPGVVVVNVGRGTAFDELALIEALRVGRVGFAALDVVVDEPLDPASPLWDFENVLISPHTAALDAAEERRIAELFADNATRFLDGRELRNRVDTIEFY